MPGGESEAWLPVHHADAVTSLQSWERLFPVASWTIEGLPVWPLIRTRLAQDLLAVGRSPARSRRGVLERVRHTVGSTVTDLRRHYQSRRQDIPLSDVVVLTRPANRQLIDGRWYDRLFDPLTDVLEGEGHSVLHLEHRPDGSRHHLPTYRPTVGTRWSVTERNVIAALQSVRGGDLERFREFTDAVRREHPSVSVKSPVWIARRARSVASVARFFEDILRQAAPRVVLCSPYYTLVGMAICLAAQRLGIRSVDVQHGVTSGNPAYEGWSSFPDHGYPLLPDVFWCWSDADARPVNAWPATGHGHRTLVGGHPWMALWRTSRSIVKAATSQLPPRADSGLTVLVTLTWSSGFSELLRQIIVSAPASWRWWVRLHPLMGRDTLAVSSWCAQHAAGRAFVDAPTDLPLPLLLEHVDVHLTHNSSVVQEAARLGVASVVIDSHALGVYDELKTGWAVFADGPAGVYDKLTLQYRAASTLTPPVPYPSWSEMTHAIRALIADSTSCRATATTASCPTPARA